MAASGQFFGRAGLIQALGARYSMIKQRQDDPRTPLQRHGYIFSLLFGGITLLLVELGIDLVGFDSSAPANTLPTWLLLLLFVGVLGCVALGYCLALIVSDSLHRLLLKIRSK
jgi:hypothetical protein